MLDDGLYVWNKNDKYTNEMWNELIKYRQKLKFTNGTENNNKISYLDTEN